MASREGSTGGDPVAKREAGRGARGDEIQRALNASWGGMMRRTGVEWMSQLDGLGEGVKVCAVCWRLYAAGWEAEHRAACDG